MSTASSSSDEHKERRLDKIVRPALFAV